MKPTLIVCILALGLAACSRTITKEKIREVPVPVAVHAVKPENIPAVPAALPPRPENLATAADVLLLNYCDAVTYIIKAHPQLMLAAGLDPIPVHPFPECEGRLKTGR